MSFGESIAPLLGRLVLSWFFIVQGLRYLRDWNDTALILSMKAVPQPTLVLLVALLAALLGSLSLLLGFRTRIGALALFAVTLATTVTLHDYWHIKATVARDADFDLFARNIAIAGGLLMLIGLGSGKFAIDNVSKAGGGGKHAASAGKH